LGLTKGMVLSSPKYFVCIGVWKRNLWKKENQINQAILQSSVQQPLF